VGGNTDFPASVDVIVQENTRANMARMDAFANNATGMAEQVFADRMTVGSGSDAVELYYFGPGHTNGDAWVVFPSARAVHTGDIFASRGVPLVDAANGGSVLHYAETVGKAYAGMQNVETIIAGHTPQTMPWCELGTFVEFNQDFLAWAQAQLAAGKTPEEAAAEWTLPEKYAGAGYSPNVSGLFGGLAGRIQRLADEAGGTVTRR
jgi:glyoxylase-like metal-dependent hydrolase (beta-lactamase superfamily II)